jgi:hypothetical protein
VEEVIPFFGDIVKGLINRWLSGEELDVEEKEAIVEAWKVLYEAESGCECKSERRCGILSDVLKYAANRLGVYEVDWICVIVEFMDGIVWKVFEDGNEGEESGIWEDCEDGEEDGWDVGEEGWGEGDRVCEVV